MKLTTFNSVKTAFFALAAVAFISSTGFDKVKEDKKKFVFGDIEELFS